MVLFAQLHPILVPFAVALLVMGVVFEYYGKFKVKSRRGQQGGLISAWGLRLRLPP